MIRLFLSTSALIAVFVASACNAIWIDRLTSSYAERLEYAQELTTNNHWKEAAQLTAEVYAHWESQSFPLYVLLRHGDIDKIQICFQSVSQYLEQEDEEPYVANNAQLIAQLKLLSEMEQLSLENIL